MNCPKCGEHLPSNMSTKIKFCPICGESLFRAGKHYLIEVQCTGQRDDALTPMMVFVDEKLLYEVRPGEKIVFAVTAGFHVLKFRHKIRNKVISILVTANYVIRAHFNTLSGLIETNVSTVEGTDEGMDALTVAGISVTAPVMISEDGQRSFDVLLGEDDPEYEIRVTSGLQEGILKIFTERCEFTPAGQMKKDITSYKDVLAVKKKMGAMDLLCEGNVHKVYSIPKDIYNEVLAYLNNRIEEVNVRS